MSDAIPLPTNLCVGIEEARSDAPLIGVLALQGGFHEHKVMLGRLGARVTEIRQPKDLTAELDALVVPGGESTTMAHLARHLCLLGPLRDFAASGRPVMGTCAGLIFLADDVDGQKEGGQELMGGLDVTVRRNYFGSQVDSFQTTLNATFAPEKDIDVRLPRAPPLASLSCATRRGPPLSTPPAVRTPRRWSSSAHRPSQGWERTLTCSARSTRSWLASTRRAASSRWPCSKRASSASRSTQVPRRGAGPGARLRGPCMCRASSFLFRLRPLRRRPRRASQS